MKQYCNRPIVILLLFNKLKIKTMKKFFGILLTLTLFVSAPVAAQFDWGIKAGVNITQKPSNLDEVIDNVKGKSGWFVGPMAKVTIPVIGLGVEANLLYSQYKSQIGERGITRQSIDLPVYLRYEISLPVVNKFLEPFIAVGPQWSWNIGDKDIRWDELGSSTNYKYKLRNSNLSLNLGLGAVFFNHVQLHANYNIALGSTSDYEGVVSSVTSAIENIKSKTNTWQVSVAYIF